MRRFVLTFAAFVFFVAAYPLELRAQTVMDISCNAYQSNAIETSPPLADPTKPRPVNPPSPMVAFYPAPYLGAIRDDAMVGRVIECSKNDGTAFAPTDPLKICGSYFNFELPVLLEFPTKLTVTKTASCLQIDAEHLSPPSLSSPTESTQLCHGPLKRATAPNPDFYAAESFTMVPTGLGPLVLPPGTCHTMSGAVAEIQAVCAPTKLGAPYLNQLLDLENSAYYTFKMQLYSGCGVYEQNTLAMASAPQPSPSPTPTRPPLRP